MLMDVKCVHGFFSSITKQITCVAYRCKLMVREWSWTGNWVGAPYCDQRVCMPVGLLKLIYSATPVTAKLSCLCRARFGGVNWIPDNSRLSLWQKIWSLNTLIAIVQFTPPHQIKQDCHACPSTAAATQARQSVTPSRPTAHTRRRCTPRKM